MKTDIVKVCFSQKNKRNIRSSHQRWSVKKCCFKYLAIFTGKHLFWSLFLINLQSFRPSIFLKENPAQVFSYEYCKIFKNTYSEEHLRTAASGLIINSLKVLVTFAIIDRLEFFCVLFSTLKTIFQCFVLICVNSTTSSISTFEKQSEWIQLTYLSWISSFLIARNF